MPYRLPGFASSRRAPFSLALALLIPAACSLTEEVRTRPGGPGEVNFGDGGFGGRRFTGGKSGLDGGGDSGTLDGAADGSGGRGAAGSGGRSGAGGIAALDGAVPIDGNTRDPGACPVVTTFACHDYCGALSLVHECRHMLEKSARVQPDGGTWFPDGSLPHELSISELIARCKCDCELHYRTPECRFDFDQFIMCAEPPLTTVCATDPGLEDEMPSVVGPCGALRANFVRCLETPPPPPPDGGPS